MRGGGFPDALDFAPAPEAGAGFSEPQFSALTAGVLSFASPKESSQRKGDPRVDAGLCPVPCATRRAGRLRNSGLRPSDSPRRLPPARLRCSASPRGTRKASRRDGSAEKWIAAVNRKIGPKPKNCDRFAGPLERRRATQAGAEKGRALSEGRSPELRSPRVSRVAQGTGRSPAPTQGCLFLWLLSFGQAKESTPARQARKPAVANKEVRQRSTPAGNAESCVKQKRPTPQAPKNAFEETPGGFPS